MRTLPLLIFVIGFFTFQSFAQKGDAGDAAGEKQLERVPREAIPPAPALAPAEALKSFRLQPGFRIELVASEPIVHNPVMMAFDPAGRIWVVEMSGYMPNADGKGEEQPVGKVVVLEDIDGDGKMDKRTEFLGGLVLPNSLSLVRDGVLVGAPPQLWFCRDTNGDLKCDEKVEVAKDYGVGGNPQHTANGLLWARDNWIYSAVWTFRLRSLPSGGFMREATIPRGQYGISQDDQGRLVYNSNSDQFRFDLVPSNYLQRNPDYPGAIGANIDPINNQATFPIRVTPGVNRGYREGQLRADGTLATFTACCSPLIYRGSQFPKELYGDAFTCEPSGNLIKHNRLWEDNGMLRGAQAYTNAEFLASTDERFRPTYLSNGPDGALYVVDFYHGILEHRLFLTSYLRKQIESRGLEKPIGLGRIYRIVHEGRPLQKGPSLATASSHQLVQMLAHPEGWVRDTAQRLLVERADSSTVSALQKVAATSETPFAQVQALWTLDGMGQIDDRTLLSILSSPSPKVRAAAVRLAEPFLKAEEAFEFIDRFNVMAGSESAFEVQLQLALTLGQTADVRAADAMLTIALHSCTNLYIRDALLTGVYGRASEFLGTILKMALWKEEKPGRDLFLRGLARCVFATRRTDAINQLFELATQANGWQRNALLDGIISAAAQGKPVPSSKLVRFREEPTGWKKLQAFNDPRMSERCAGVGGLITWPGRPDYDPPQIVRALTIEEQNRFDLGRELYTGICAGCHQLNGLGLEGLAPPLVDSAWVLGSERRLANIALHGIHGPLDVKGRTWNLDMPGLGAALNDDQIAAVLTYLRREWDHVADPVSPLVVRKVRNAAERAEALSEVELLKIP